MSPNRPFLSNFLTAFRAQSSVRGAVTSSASTLTSTSSATATLTASSSQTTTAAAATASTATRTLTTKVSAQTTSNATTTTGTTTVAIQTSTFQPSRHHHPHTSSPLSLSPGGLNPGGPLTSTRGRRGSDSSNEGGFRDAMGAEKWYIGGRTAAGEERFYKLSMVKRPRSIDRLSLDRMSL